MALLASGLRGPDDGRVADVTGCCDTLHHGSPTPYTPQGYIDHSTPYGISKRRGMTSVIEAMYPHGYDANHGK